MLTSKWTTLRRRGGTNFAEVLDTERQIARSSKIYTTMSQTSRQDEQPGSSMPSTAARLLDPAAFEAYAKAAKQAVADGLARRALMAQTPPSKSKH